MKNFTEKQNRIADFILETFSKCGLEEPKGLLRFKYLSPGGPYTTNLWDWDCYWTAFGLIGIMQNRKDNEALKKLQPYVEGSFLNFLAHQGADGALPILIMPQEEDPFDCLKSADNNMAKPFIAQLAELLDNNDMISNKAEFGNKICGIHSYHKCFEERYLDRNTGLVLYAKDWGIGFDDDPTVWGRPLKSCAPLFLNCFLYCDYMAAMRLCLKYKRPDYAEEYKKRLERLKNAIQKYCWDEREKAFFSFDIQSEVRLTQHRFWGVLNRNLEATWHGIRLKVLTWSSFLPFYCGIGTKEQFTSFIKENLTSDRLMGKYGIRSVSADEAMYAPEVARGNPSNWLGPIWIIANYIAWEAFKKYDFKDKADELVEIIINMLHQDLEDNGSFHEYYSPESGLGVHNPNFMSWTTLAGIMTK